MEREYTSQKDEKKPLRLWWSYTAAVQEKSSRKCPSSNSDPAANSDPQRRYPESWPTLAAKRKLSVSPPRSPVRNEMVSSFSSTTLVSPATWRPNLPAMVSQMLAMLKQSQHTSCALTPRTGAKCSPRTSRRSSTCRWRSCRSLQKDAMQYQAMHTPQASSTSRATLGF
jgi:hypothetical protein